MYVMLLYVASVCCEFEIVYSRMFASVLKGELQHGREESSRRWQLDRQNYERQINDAEQTIESLRKERQALEDTIIEEKSHASSSADAKSSSSSSVRHSHRAKGVVLEIEEPESQDEQQLPADAKRHTSRPPTARPMTSKADQQQLIDSKSLVSVFEDCILQLVEYNDARRQVLCIIKEKKGAEQSKDEAAKRINALEMQKMRQSLSVRESISDVSKSIRLINEKMQVENRTLEELERLKKLKERAERKLRGLRKQEEHDEFLDGDTQQELTDLVELIEDLNSHIAFQDAELVLARDDLNAIKTRSRADDASPIDGLTTSIVQRLRPGSNQLDATEFVKKILEEVSSFLSYIQSGAR